MPNENEHHLDDKIIRIKARFALLYYLGKAGADRHEIKAQDTYKPTAQILGLSDREQTITIKEKNGVGEDRPWWPNIVQWARLKLKDIGALGSSAHGYWRLSAKGKKQYELLIEKLNSSGKDFEEFVEALVAEKRGRD